MCTSDSGDALTQLSGFVIPIHGAPVGTARSNSLCRYDEPTGPEQGMPARDEVPARFDIKSA